MIIAILTHIAKVIAVLVGEGQKWPIFSSQASYKTLKPPVLDQNGCGGDDTCVSLYNYFP